MQLRGPELSSQRCLLCCESGSRFAPNNPFRALLIDTLVAPLRKQPSNDAVIDLTFGTLAVVVLRGGGR